MPSYRTERGTEFTVPGVSTAECPVSLITPKSQELVQLFSRTRRLKESAGASLYGPDLSAWPAWIVDAFEVLEQENARYENARFDADKLGN